MPAPSRRLDQVGQNPGARGRRVILKNRKCVFESSLVATEAELEDQEGIAGEVNDASLPTLEGIRQVGRRPRAGLNLVAAPGQKVGVSACGGGQHRRISGGRRDLETLLG